MKLLRRPSPKPRQNAARAEEINMSENNIWPADRRAEIGKLERLLNIVTSLNSSTNFLSNAQKAIDIAEELREFNIDSGRPSFVHFIVEKAIQPDPAIAQRDELLEALQRIAAMTAMDADQVSEIARAAIAKAKGEA